MRTYTKESIGWAIKRLEQRINILNERDAVGNLNLVKKAEREIRKLKDIEKTL